MTAEVQERLLKACEPVAFGLAHLRADMSLHGIAREEGEAVGRALHRLQCRLRTETPEEVAAPRAFSGSRFTEAMVPKRRD